jgi:hypothetical protein
MKMKNYERTMDLHIKFIENIEKIVNNILTELKYILKYQLKEKRSLERYLKQWRDSVL